MAASQNIVTLAATGILSMMLIISSANAKSILLTELGKSSSILNNSTENVTSSTGSSTTSQPAPSTSSSPQAIGNPVGDFSFEKGSVKEGERKGRYDPSVNPFPSYYPPQLGGSTGNGVAASSCAYAYPNRRYSCYGLGRK